MVRITNYLTTKFNIRRPKLGFGLAAECAQLCIFGQYSASAEYKNYSSAKPSASAIIYLALAEGDSTAVYIYYIHCNLVIMLTLGAKRNERYNETSVIYEMHILNGMKRIVIDVRHC